MTGPDAGAPSPARAAAGRPQAGAAAFSRRAFLHGGGVLVVGFSLAGPLAGRAAAAGGISAGTTPDPAQLDSWIRINADGTINLLTSQIEVGNGVTTGLLQISPRNSTPI